METIILCFHLSGTMLSLSLRIEWEIRTFSTSSLTHIVGVLGSVYHPIQVQRLIWMFLKLFEFRELWMSSHIYLLTETNQKKLLPDYHWVLDLIQRHNGFLSLASCNRSTLHSRSSYIWIFCHKKDWLPSMLLPIGILMYVFLCHQSCFVQIPQRILCRLHPD